MLRLDALLPHYPLPASLAGMRVARLCLDSRQVQAGDVFVALQGTREDGRRYVADAIANGAALVLTDAERDHWRQQDGVPMVGVRALRAQLGELAARLYGHPGSELQVIGITGTNGKTSCSWFLADALNALGRRAALMGTLGVRYDGELVDLGHTTPDPITLQAALGRCREQGAKTVVMEVSSHALDQHRLAGTPVSVAVFTNLTRDHLDYHGDMASYLAAKRRLFERPELQLAVFNDDDPASAELRGALLPGCKVVSFGHGVGADLRVAQVTRDTQGLRGELQCGERRWRFALPLFGGFNLDNLMAVAAVLVGLGATDEELMTALAAVTPVPGRMEPVGSQPQVLVDYAHTPDGLEKALTAARQHFSGRLWCVVGCGGNRDHGKRPLMAAVAERLADCVVLTSDNPRDEAPAAILQDMAQGLATAERAWVIEDRAEAIARVIAEATVDDVVLIAGKGHERWQEVAGQRLPFDDREHARAALQQRAGGAA
ncbi:UDP-N-acetylmuramoyl-L-alanyl-D-glutamate--2,6-diaminopimelate ligase [Isoalcanivorax beigongshangi]|uniref:UDP-N-acetylmuramoyl-L-alanyl-D-glutamate--2,6-diaminopimelate ligase n=1 Tax=Isoalcanivorax beigongshangi TaxID=3238810 RepID=A0ABV4AJM0_9GAMM